ncbi:hypothetical protein ERO13_A09G091400v2 [Gossypium hirsutum]|nr:hypothetical protein ERO13_A09G091400v2 [Gossypium hirsutum]KAG4183167.1 hypothetical protein ERO13_A09G091400v2 [Gossypium hirsutum]KAG4183168.1 hypothetical protein ERO13_A09G091400v2 [Gossypium hirsutum]
MIKKMFNFEAENFCKVYLATHSIHSVFFPATAIVCPLTPATATLRNCNGQCWQVDLVKCDNKMYFLKGWRRFIDENSVVNENFLIFNYVGGCVFDVKGLMLVRRAYHVWCRKKKKKNRNRNQNQKMMIVTMLMMKELTLRRLRMRRSIQKIMFNI